MSHNYIYVFDSGLAFKLISIFDEGLEELLAYKSEWDLELAVCE